MTGKTTIEWTHMPGFEGDVWNPTTGCTRVSAGCDNCYAFALHDKRFSQNAMRAKHFGETVEPNPARRIANARAIGRTLPWPKQYDLPFSRVQLLPERLEVPLRVRKPTCYFVDSMADLFHDEVPDEFVAKVFGTMEGAQQHRFLILTKRPERMRRWVDDHYGDATPSANIWLGTSVEDQASADERIPHLLATPAAVRFLSCEPLLGPVDLRGWMQFPVLIGTPIPTEAEFERIRREWGKAMLVALPPRQELRIERRNGLHWVIVGGESGPRARPMDLAWARSLVEQCRAAGVAPFVKQMGSRPVDPQTVLTIDAQGEHRVTDIREPHGRDMAEWPEDLRIREWPLSSPTFSPEQGVS